MNDRDVNAPNPEAKPTAAPEAKVNTRPSHLAYTVRQGKDGQAHFNRVGAMFPHKDGNGFDVQMDATPVDGRLTLRTLKERVQGQAPQTPQQAKGQSGERDRS